MLRRCAGTPDGLYLLAGPVVLRCQDPKTKVDKEYQVAVFYDDKNKDFPVFCAWGGWHQVLAGQIKGREADEDAAVVLATEWLTKKQKRGYVAADVTNDRFDNNAVKSALVDAYMNRLKSVKAPTGLAEPDMNYHQKKAQGNTVVFSAQNWHDFLRNTGIVDVELHDYYLNGTKPQGKADYETLVGELFLDAVSAGAILLPKGVDAQDFTFSFLRRKPDSETEDTLTVSHEPTAEARSFMLLPEKSLFPVQLSDHRVTRLFDRMCQKTIGVMDLP